MPRTTDLPEVIRDKDGNPMRRSRNLAGIRRYVADRYSGPIASVNLHQEPDGEGRLFIMFDDGANYETRFASFHVMLGWVRRWRNVHGARLYVNSIDCGVVRRDNPAFADAR